MVLSIDKNRDVGWLMCEKLDGIVVKRVFEDENQYYTRDESDDMGVSGTLMVMKHVAKCLDETLTFVKGKRPPSFYTTGDLMLISKK